jgi:sugar/nucleoside kinase (ribokinase family)
MTKMFEISFFEDHPLSEEKSREVCNYLKANLHSYDMVLVSDFGHGFIGKEIVEVLCKGAKFLAVNSQTNSANMGFNLITKYPKADYVCIDEPEIRYAAQSKFGRLEDLILEVSKKLRCKRVTVTRGHLGALTYAEEEGFYETPVLSTKIVDRVGAGDAFLSITSPCVAVGYPMDLVGLIGNAVGALAVGIVCNRSSVEPVPLFKFVGTLLK